MTRQRYSQEWSGNLKERIGLSEVKCTYRKKTLNVGEWRNWGATDEGKINKLENGIEGVTKNEAQIDKTENIKEQ